MIDFAEHEEIMWNFGQSRIYLGISISDAISTSVLESMAMGCFPIQTNTSCCEEWFEFIGGVVVGRLGRRGKLIGGDSASRGDRVGDDAERRAVLIPDCQRESPGRVQDPSELSDAADTFRDGMCGSWDGCGEASIDAAIEPFDPIPSPSHP